MSICGTARSVSLRELPTELIQFILKHFAIQDLKKCHSINNIWGDEVIQEIRRRLEFGSRYPTVKELAIGTPNADKKVMIRGWIKREKVAVTLPNIFDGLKPPSYLGIDTKTFVVVDKPEYDLV
uniref:F-box domain-containing protein n=1 Tax=Rhizophagus irregularis (strain DAOM 181602 / DAOM 197198 / MUCL 43194) TaxID=747089 RepID=U9TB27_RHIID